MKIPIKKNWKFNKNDFIFVSVIIAEGGTLFKSTYNNVKSYEVRVTFYTINTSLGTT